MQLSTGAGSLVNLPHIIRLPWGQSQALTQGVAWIPTCGSSIKLGHSLCAGWVQAIAAWPMNLTTPFSPLRTFSARAGIYPDRTLVPDANGGQRAAEREPFA